MGDTIGKRDLTKTDGKYTLVASDYYFDCTKSVIEMAIVFLTQCSLLTFYVLGLVTSGSPDFSDGKVFMFYYAG